MAEIPFLEFMTSAFGDTEGRAFPSRGISVAPGGVDFPSWVAGEVVLSEYDDALGNMVVVRNRDDGYFIGVSHLAHRDVRKGDPVEIGTVLGLIGATGTGCVGRCAYISVSPLSIHPRGGHTIDPVKYAARTRAES